MTLTGVLRLEAWAATAGLCVVQGIKTLMYARQAVFSVCCISSCRNCNFSISNLCYLSDQLENFYQKNNLRV
ncbi:hypothetical protein I79_023912 [Cricetulus griseus]|uniref:Secreted protein n=1 Tax=Cricetulus griseus TaxID=10029 RepID=G3IJ80_CRIGR|nr:hypothetical protein I79_023912 [Cricetulus griseus]